MKILDELIATLDTTAEVRDIRQGVFHTAVVTRQCGLASTLPKDAMRQPKPLVKEPGKLLEKSAVELVKMAYSDSLLEAAVGMAAINSLLKVDGSACRQVNARELIAERGAGKRVVIVGHFPFIPYIKTLAAELAVIEKNPAPGDVGEDQAEKLIPAADVAAITGTAFTNHTIEKLLKLCKPDCFVVVLGDTAPLSPLLFDYGIDAVAGTRVDDVEATLRCVSQGANYRQIQGVRQLAILKE
jgi:uncharacterized protein (DUF4213/DUF364 family)